MTRWRCLVQSSKWRTSSAATVPLGAPPTRLCQWPAAQEWLAAREAEVLAVPYFHVGFTLSAGISAIAYQNKPKVYGLLFTAAAAVLIHCRRSQAPRRQHRRHRRPAHLGSESPASSPCPLHRARRWPIATWPALDCLQAQLLSSGPRA